MLAGTCGPGRLYRWCWWTCTAPIWSLSVCGALLLGQPGIRATAGFCFGFLLGSVAACWALGWGMQGEEALRFGFRVGLLTTVLYLAVIGMFAILEWPAALLLAGLAATSPVGMGAVARLWLSARPTPTHTLTVADRAARPERGRGPVSPPPVHLERDLPGVIGRSAFTGSAAETVELRDLGIEEVVRAWRVSYCMLSGAATPQLVGLLAEYRYWCIAELERRDPDGLQRWLDSGARAAGNPGRFLTGEPGGG